MSETKDVKQTLKEELNSLIGKYIPNKIDLENLMNYLYKMFVVTFKDVDMQKEYEKINGISEVDRQAFLRALHTIALSSSSNVMYQTLKETFKSIKNQVDLVQVIKEPSAQYPSQYAPSPIIQNHQSGGLYPMRSVDPNEGNFNIDLSGVGRVDESAKEALAKEIERSKEVDLQYAAQMSQQRHIQSRVSWSSSDQDFNISQESLSSFNMSSGISQEKEAPDDAMDDNFMSDASSYSDGSYDSTPVIHKDLDY